MDDFFCCACLEYFPEPTYECRRCHAKRPQTSHLRPNALERLGALDRVLGGAGMGKFLEWHECPDKDCVANGDKVPTYQAHCPKCDATLPRPDIAGHTYWDYEQNRDAVRIAILGGPSSGKTHYLHALERATANEPAYADEHHGFDLSVAWDATWNAQKDSFGEGRVIPRTAQTLRSTTREEQPNPSHLWMLPRNPSSDTFGKPVLLTLRDVAGEDFRDFWEREKRFVQACRGVMLLSDIRYFLSESCLPTPADAPDLYSFTDQERDDILSGAAPSGAGSGGPDTTAAGFLERLKGIIGMGIGGGGASKPFALVITKSDILWHALGEGDAAHPGPGLPDRHAMMFKAFSSYDRYPLKDSTPRWWYLRQLDREASKLLETDACMAPHVRERVRTAVRNLRVRHTFFVSATGCQPHRDHWAEISGAGGSPGYFPRVAPTRVFDPLFWLISKTACGNLGDYWPPAEDGDPWQT